jgi:membrane AbrB-like protein
VQWGLLVPLSLLLAAALEMAGLPAAFLLGPMLAGIVLGTSGAAIRTPRLPALAAQTVVGCLMGRVLTADIALSFARDWPLLVGVVLVILLTSGLLGWMIARLGVLPGTTAIWGVAPGAASAMMIMAGEFGADARLVAFMQYLRVVCVAGLASLVARIWVGPIGTGAHAIVWFPALPWIDFAATLAVAGIAGGIGIALRFPAGALFLPLFASAVLSGMGLVAIVLPPWLLAASYAILGWSVGLAFNRDILAHAARALPPILLAIAVLIAVCGALAAALVHLAGVDPLTAYLATSPGGMDSIAIIGASSKVDLAFVMALQTVRFMVVLVLGPPLARFMAQRLRRG